MKELLSMFKQLSEEQRVGLIRSNPEMAQVVEILAKAEFFEKMFSDPQFYKDVQTTVCNMFLETVR